MCFKEDDRNPESAITSKPSLPIFIHPTLMTSSSEQLARYRRRTRWAWAGLVLQPIAFLVMGSFTELDAMSVRGITGAFLLLLSIVLVNIGIWNYAKLKGYGNGVAALSLLNIYGLLILLCLPNRNRHRS